MAQQPLAPPPKTGQTLDGWLYLLWKRISSSGQLLWSYLDFTGSNLTDLATRNHNDLQSIAGGASNDYSHLTAAQLTDLTDAGDSTLHYHSDDRALENITGLGPGVATFLATPSSSNFASAVTGETGSGALVFGTGPTLASPTITTSPTAAGATWASLGTVTTADINGGTIDGTVIGGASAAAGTFTTLTATGNTVLGDAATDTVALQAGSATLPALIPSGDVNTGIWFPAADTVAVSTGGTERQRINSAGQVLVGATAAETGGTLPSIGQQWSSTSGLANLGQFRYSSDATAAVFCVGKARGGTIGARGVLSAGDEVWRLDARGADGTNLLQCAQLSAFVDGTPSTGVVPGRWQFSTAHPTTGTLTLRWVLDSSGNTNLGTNVPHAWTAFQAHEIERIGALVADNSAQQTELIHNAYYDGGWKYSFSYAASRILQSSNGTFFHHADAGTADATATFTQTLALAKDKSLALQGASSQTGAGITFPATQSASSNANTLDDYDEYTAASTACTGAITTACVWKLTKTGNQVTLMLPAVQGAGVATTNFTVGLTIPSKYRPAADFASVSAPIINNAAKQSAPGMIKVTSAGVISVWLNGTESGNFTVTANAGLAYTTSISWTI